MLWLFRAPRAVRGISRPRRLIERSAALAEQAERDRGTQVDVDVHGSGSQHRKLRRAAGRRASRRQPRRAGAHRAVRVSAVTDVKHVVALRVRRIAVVPVCHVGRRRSGQVRGRRVPIAHVCQGNFTGEVADGQQQHEGDETSNHVEGPSERVGGQTMIRGNVIITRGPATGAKLVVMIIDSNELLVKLQYAFRY